MNFFDHEFSRTNLYIGGLKANSTDEDLSALCRGFGPIASVKAIVDPDTGVCKGYGFVLFHNPVSAKLALDCLAQRGMQVMFAKPPRNPDEIADVANSDPTNLYISGIPREYDEAKVASLIRDRLGGVGDVLSCRVLRDHEMSSKCVALARMSSPQAADIAIRRLSGTSITGRQDLIRVKLANGSSTRKPFKTAARGDAVSAEGSSTIWGTWEVPEFIPSSNRQQSGWQTRELLGSSSQSFQNQDRLWDTKPRVTLNDAWPSQSVDDLLFSNDNSDSATMSSSSVFSSSWNSQAPSLSSRPLSEPRTIGMQPRHRSMTSAPLSAWTESTTSMASSWAASVFPSVPAFPSSSSSAVGQSDWSLSVRSNDIFKKEKALFLSQQSLVTPELSPNSSVQPNHHHKADPLPSAAWDVQES